MSRFASTATRSFKPPKRLLTVAAVVLALTAVSAVATENAAAYQAGFSNAPASGHTGRHFWAKVGVSEVLSGVVGAVCIRYLPSYGKTFCTWISNKAKQVVTSIRGCHGFWVEIWSPRTYAYGCW